MSGGIILPSIDQNQRRNTDKCQEDQERDHETPVPRESAHYAWGEHASPPFRNQLLQSGTRHVVVELVVGTIGLTGPFRACRQVRDHDSLCVKTYR